MLTDDQVKGLLRFRADLLEAKRSVEGALAGLQGMEQAAGGVGTRIIAQVVGPDGTIKQEFVRDD